MGKRRQRPYYSVSQEEYQHMQTILRHYLPEAELTLPTLRTMASRCDEQQSRGSLLQLTPGSSDSPASPRESMPVEDLTSALAEEDDALEEVVSLQKELGCLLADARGEYRKTRFPPFLQP